MSVTPALAEGRWLRLATAVVGLTVPLIWLWTTVTPSEVTVRIRNGLAAQVGRPADFDWTPDRVPPTYLVNRSGVPAAFQEIAAGMHAGSPSSDRESEFERSLAIARELMRAPNRKGSPIGADTLRTYRAITEEGRGYCADFVKVFNGLALAGQMPVRQWGFAFSAFGSGHTFNEVFDHDRGKWVLVDSFHSLFFVDPETREPLSVLEVHDRLLNLHDLRSDVEIVRIVPDRFPFRSEALALNYYRRGMQQLWLVWGNSVFDFEEHPVTGLVSRVSRAAAQLVGLVIGRYPAIRIYPEGVSERDLRELFRARTEFFLALAACGVSFLVFGLQGWRSWRGRETGRGTVRGGE